MLQICYEREEGIGTVLVWIWWFKFCESPWSQVSWLCMSSCGFLDPIQLDQLSCFLPQDSLSFFLMFRCWSLDLFPSGARWNLSGSSYDRLLFASIQSIINGVRGYLHGMGLRLGMSLVVHFFSLCSIFIPAFLLDRNSSRLKFLKVGWGHLVYLLEMDLSGSISPLLGIFNDRKLNLGKVRGNIGSNCDQKALST